MGRKKGENLGVFSMKPGFGGFGQQDVEDLKDALGQEISEEFRIELEGEISGWLMRFGDYGSLGYGARERKLISSAQKAGAKLYAHLCDLGELGALGVEDIAYAQGVTADEFMAVLSNIKELRANIDQFNGVEFDVAAIQIQMLRDILKYFGFRVTYSTKNYVTRFNPSAFTRFVATLWRVEPRLRMFEPSGEDDWNSLSQWIGHQLRKPDAVSAVGDLVLLRRRKLGKRSKPC